MSANMPVSTTSAREDWFATTHWSLVVHAGQAQNTLAREALETLCAKYWLPLYSFVRRRGYSAEDAQDLTQEFFSRLIQRNRLARADQRKGRFRAFLLSSMKNFLADEFDKARAQKRGGGKQPLSLEFDTGEAIYRVEPVDNTTPEQIYERRWAITLLDTVLAALHNEHEHAGKAELFDALRPCLVGDRTAQPYGQLAEKLGMSETGVKSAVHRLRKRYRELLRREIANTVSRPEEVEDELNYLFAVLSRES